MDKYLTWYEMSLSLKRIKEEEAKLRRELCEELFGGRVGNFKEVVEGDRYTIVAKSTTTTTLDERALQQLMGGLGECEKACIKFKPSLIAANYKLLPESSLLHEAVIVKPAMPTLSMELHS